VPEGKEYLGLGVILFVIGFCCIIGGLVLSVKEVEEYIWVEHGPWTRTIEPGYQWTWWPELNEGDKFYINASGSVFDVLILDPNGNIVWADIDLVSITRTFTAQVSGEYEVRILNKGIDDVHVEFGIIAKESYKAHAFRPAAGDIAMIVIGFLILGSAVYSLWIYRGYKAARPTVTPPTVTTPTGSQEGA